MRNNMVKLRHIYLSIAFLVLLVLLGLFKLYGFMDILDHRVASFLSGDDNIYVEAFTETASLEAFVVYLLVWILIDYYRFRKISLNYKVFLVSLIILTLLEAFFKLVFRIPRPGAIISHDLGGESLTLLRYYSYPSGHTARSFLLAMYLDKRTRLSIARIALWLWAIGIALSRIIIGVHWATDVFGGVCLALSTYYILEILVAASRGSASFL